MSNKNKHNKSVGSSIERSNERLKVSGEFFTPLSLCSKIVNEIPLDILKNPESKFLDNSAGNGSFLLALTIITYYTKLGNLSGKIGVYGL